MKSFNDFFTDLTSDQIWFENASMYWKPETFEKCARQVWMQGVADGILKPIQECRKHVFNIVKNLPHDRIKPDWTKKALEKLEVEKEEWKPVSWEERKEWLKRWQAELDKFNVNRVKPILDYNEVGQERLPRPKATGWVNASRIAVLRHLVLVRRSRRKFYLEKNPGASEEEIKAYIDKFKTL